MWLLPSCDGHGWADAVFRSLNRKQITCSLTPPPLPSSSCWAPPVTASSCYSLTSLMKMMLDERQRPSDSTEDQNLHTTTQTCIHSSPRCSETKAALIRSDPIRSDQIQNLAAAGHMTPLSSVGSEVTTCCHQMFFHSFLRECTPPHTPWSAEDDVSPQVSAGSPPPPPLPHLQSTTSSWKPSASCCCSDQTTSKQSFNVSLLSWRPLTFDLWPFTCFPRFPPNAATPGLLTDPLSSRFPHLTQNLFRNGLKVPRRPGSETQVVPEPSVNVFVSWSSMVHEAPAGHEVRNLLKILAFYWNQTSKRLFCCYWRTLLAQSQLWSGLYQTLNLIQVHQSPAESNRWLVWTRPFLSEDVYFGGCRKKSFSCFILASSVTSCYLKELPAGAQQLPVDFSQMLFKLMSKEKVFIVFVFTFQSKNKQTKRSSRHV